MVAMRVMWMVTGLVIDGVIKVNGVILDIINITVKARAWVRVSVGSQVTVGSDQG